MDTSADVGSVALDKGVIQRKVSGAVSNNGTALGLTIFRNGIVASQLAIGDGELLGTQVDAAANALRAQAEAEAEQILAQAQTEAANLKARTQKECDEQAEAAARSRAQTEADCKAMLARTQQEIRQRWAAFDRRASELLDGYHSTEFLPEERADK